MNFKKILLSWQVLSIFLLAILSIGGFLYIDEVNWDKEVRCANLGIQIREENKTQMQKVGLDKTDLYQDEYVYNKKLKTCLYYKSQRPLLYDPKNEVAFFTQEIINASTNEKIISLIKLLNPEIPLDKGGTVSCTSVKKWSCETEDDFYKIKGELFGSSGN